MTIQLMKRLFDIFHTLKVRFSFLYMRSALIFDAPLKFIAMFLLQHHLVDMYLRM